MKESCSKCGTEFPAERCTCPNCGAASTGAMDVLPAIFTSQMNENADRKLHPENFPLVAIQHNEFHLHKHEANFSGLFQPFDFSQDDGTKADPSFLFLAYGCWGMVLLFTAVMRDFVTLIIGGAVVFLLISFYLFSRSRDKRRHGKFMVALGVLWAIEICVWPPTIIY